MDADDREETLRDQLSRQGQEALGRLAEDLVRNPALAGAIGRAFAARERASQVQEVAMGALGIPSAADVERVTRRLRSVAQRLEGIEDTLDRLDERLDALDRLDRRLEGVERLASRADSAASNDERPVDSPTGGLESRLDDIARDLALLRGAVGAAEEPPPRAQERFTVSEA